MGSKRKLASAQVALAVPAEFGQSQAQAQPGGGGGNPALGSSWNLRRQRQHQPRAARRLGRPGSERRNEKESSAPGCCLPKRGELSMGKKWRDAAEMERGCSDREDSAENRRRSRSASRGRFAESWKRLSSKQGSTKRSGLPSQQTPVSGLETALSLSFPLLLQARALSMVLNLS